MLSLQEFGEALAPELEKLFEGCKITVSETLKVNDTKMTTVIIQKNEVNLGMTLYLGEIYRHYKEGESLAEIATKLYEAYSSNIVTEPIDTKLFFDFNTIKSDIYCRLLNRQLNKELLKSVPHREFLDLAVVYYIEVKLPNLQSGTVMITDSLLNNWNGVDEKILYDTAITNLSKQPYTIENIVDILRSVVNGDFSTMFNLDESELDKMQTNCGMSIMRCPHVAFGSIALLNDKCLEECSKIYNGDFIILPSSVYELIIVPVDDTDDWAMDSSFLHNMVREVNDTQVVDTEVLSYSVYKYCADSKSLVII